MRAITLNPAHCCFNVSISHMGAVHLFFCFFEKTRWLWIKAYAYYKHVMLIQWHGSLRVNGIVHSDFITYSPSGHRLYDFILQNTEEDILSL